MIQGVSHVLIAGVAGNQSGTDWLTAQFWVEIAQAAILAIAGVFGYSQVRQARLTRLAQYRPYVIVYAEISETANTIVQIVIENIGVIPARDIKFSFSPELESTLKNSASGPVPPWSALESGIKFLAPGQRIVHLFDSLIGRYGSTLPNEYKVSITYHSREKSKIIDHDESYDINFGDWYGSNFQTVYTIHDVAESLRGINKQMREWTESRGVRVFNQGLEDLHQAQTAAREAFYKRVEENKQEQISESLELRHDDNDI